MKVQQVDLHRLACLSNLQRLSGVITDAREKRKVRIYFLRYDLHSSPRMSEVLEDRDDLVDSQLLRDEYDDCCFRLCVCCRLFELLQSFEAADEAFFSLERFFLLTDEVLELEVPIIKDERVSEELLQVLLGEGQGLRKRPRLFAAEVDEGCQGEAVERKDTSSSAVSPAAGAVRG